MNTRAEFEELFSMFSRTSVKKDDDGFFLSGRWIDLRLIDGTWDIYLRNQKEALNGNLTAKIGTKRLNTLINSPLQSFNWNKLDGEAWSQTPDTKTLLKWLTAQRLPLGLHKRRLAPKNGYRFGVKQ